MTSSIKSLLDEELFRDWLKIPENNFRLLKFLYQSDDDVLKSLIDKESLILTKSNELHNRVKVYEQGVPDEISFLTNDIIHPDLSQFLIANNINIELKTFDPSLFYEEHIQDKPEAVNKELTSEERLLNFWGFIYDYWEVFSTISGLRNSLKLINILCKPDSETGVFFQSINKTYLSKEFNPTDEVESVVEKLNIEHAKFISPKFISSKRSNNEKWKNLFEGANSITDLQKIIDFLIPKIHEIEVSKHFEITRQIFKAWKRNNANMHKQSVLLSKNLKIKTVVGEYLHANSCIISDHYNNNGLIKVV